MKSIERDNRDQVTVSVKNFLFDTYETYAKESSQNLSKSETISDMQRDPKKKRLNSKELDAEDEDDLNSVYDELKIVLI